MFSGSPDPHAEYRRRLEQRREAVARDDRRHRRIANLRLTLFMGTALLGWSILKSPALSAWWLLVPLAGFIALVIMHERVLQSRRRMERAAGFYERGLARLENRWIGSGETGDRFLDAQHPYARDLDLFGNGSLFELLCTARTRSGEDTLAGWLKASASPSEIGLRQTGISELKPRLDLREDLVALGADVRSGVDPDVLTEWSNAAAIRFPLPVIEKEGPCFDGEGIGHPFLAEDRCVPNDVCLETERRVLLVSGSNMSGKSTLLRTVGTNAVLALAGAPVRARKLRISPLSIGASLRILDSLHAGIVRRSNALELMRSIGLEV
jgi:hypothetical protein